LNQSLTAPSSLPVSSERTFNMALGKFADLSEEEFERVHLRYRPSAARVANVASELTYEKVASYLGEVQMNVASTGASSSQMEARIEQESGKSFAWTSPPNGYNAVVTPVHNQQDICASCWAFVTADSVASRWAVINGGRVGVEDMSVKQLMACDNQDNGCNTGNMYTAYDWIGDNGGLATKRDYNDAKYVSGGPEDDDTATCRDDSELKLSLDTPAMCDVKMTGGNVALMEAVRGAGPIAIGINANNLQFYDNGVINAASCPPAGRGIQSINHAALLVGWGEENGVKYWLVKNSYGLDFGENGYFRLERAAPSPDTLFGTCGLLFESVFPVVVPAGSDSDEGTLRAQCTEGSVFKQDYYRNEADNPGASASAMAEAEATLSASLGKMRARGAALGAAPWRVDSHTRGVDARWEGAKSFAVGASLVVAAAGVALAGLRLSKGRAQEETIPLIG